jgi:hypothetical protein
MTDARSNYGTRLKVGSPYSADVGELVSLDAPELLAEAVEATNQSSNGWKEYVGGGLKELSEFTATINFTDAYVPTIYADLAAGTVKSYQVQFPDDGSTKWTFNAIITGIKPLSVDAQSPETLQAEIKFQPTGANVLS